MGNEQIERLRIACNQFYLNKYMDQPIMTDLEFDRLRIEYESEMGKSVKDLVEWESELSLENEPEEGLNKTIVEDNNLKQFIINELSQVKHDVGVHYLNLKYDGGGIKLIYDKEGKLKRIQSTPDEDYGIVRTEQFWDLVPHQIDKRLGIKCLRGEVLVDPTAYGKLARNKANGLINSTVNKDEINQEAFIRVYKITYYDDRWSAERQYSTWKHIPTITKVRERRYSNSDQTLVQRFEDTVFAPAYCFGTDEIPSEALVKQLNGDFFQCDGVVLYSSKLGIKGYKYYYLDSAITEVKEVVWNRKSNGSFSAVCELEPVWLEDKYISRASANGVPNLTYMKMGKGARVRVILANTTIPKIIDVLVPSEDYQWPVCECGYQLSDKDIFGSTLKCGNKGVCKDKVSKWVPEFAQWILDEFKFMDSKCETLIDCLEIDPLYCAWALHIDRWSVDKNFNSTKLNPKDSDVESQMKDLSKKVIDSIVNYDMESFKSIMEDMFYYSDLQWDNFEINYQSAVDTLFILSKIPISEYKSRIESNNWE